MKVISISMCIFTVLILCTAPSFSYYANGSSEEEILLVNHEGDLSSITDFDVLDVYGRYAVIEVDEESSLQGLSVYENPSENKINLNSYEVDLEDLPSRDPTDNKGLYLINTLGPVNPEWRTKLEGLDIEVVDYVPDHTYKVWMEHQLSDRVDQLFFVDRVSTYPQEYKIAPDIKTGRLSIDVVEGSLERVVRQVRHLNGVTNLHILHDTNRIMIHAKDMKVMNRIAQLEEVIFISPWLERELSSELESQLIGGYWNSSDPSEPYREYGDHGAFVNQLGYSGEGVVSGLADTGLGDGSLGDAGHSDFTGRVLGGHSFSNDKNWSDGNGHGTHCAGSMAGDTYGGTGTEYAGHGPYYVSQGLAYGSNLYGQKVFTDGGSWIGPSQDYDIPRDAKVHGDVYVHSNSWGYGYSGVYYSSDSDYDRAVRDSDPFGWENDGMVITAAAGNAGEDAAGERDETSIGSPGNAKNVITVGASGTYMPDSTQFGGSIDSVEPYNVTSWSSKGWTEDNRVKPDVVAPGRSVLSTSSPMTDTDDGNIYTEDDRYEWMSGTSMATPAVTGAAAVVVEWYEDTYGERPSPAMVKALLINSARPLLNDLNSDGEIDYIPNKDEGWGMVDAGSLLSREESSFIEDQSNTLTTGEVKEYDLEFDSEDEPLKFTLVWTDRYGQAYDNPSLKNDLDLEIVSPSGMVYKGNSFQQGWTPPDTGANTDFDRNDDGSDDVNTVENIFIPADGLESGAYTVRVIGNNIPEDALNIGSPMQDFALVTHNAVFGSNGTVQLDKEEYNKEDTVNILVNDKDLMGLSEVDVLVKSDTQLEGKMMTLHPDVEDWRFTGSIELSSSEGLDVSHGDLITVVYDDGGVEKEATAVVDGMDPEVMTVEVDSGSAVRITWETDEPSWGKVVYGQSENAFCPDLSTQHEVLIDGLTPGLSYEYYIISQDTAGNQARKPSEGKHSFVVDEIDDVEAGNLGWQNDSNWDIDEGDSYSGEFHWDCGDGDYGTSWDEKLVSPRIDTSVWSEATLTWWQSYEFDYEYDGGLVEVYHDGSWVEAVPEEGYDAVLSSSENVLAGREAFTGDSEGWFQSQIDLTPFIGSDELRVRFWMGTDDYSNWPDPRIGWLIDDIGIQGEVEMASMDMSLTSSGDGWNFVSMNVVPEDTSLVTILEDPDNGISGSYEKVMYYDASIDGWSSNIPERADDFNTLASWDHNMGIWIRMSEDDILSIDGLVPSQTDVNLYPGWNMVGLPSSNSGNHAIPEEIEIVGYFDGSEEYNLAYDYDPSMYIFEPGQGYWLYNGAGYEVIWTVEY
ncbi:MAG: S8 family serine peptidase [Candidatus Saliniplasma sp.]